MAGSVTIQGQITGTPVGTVSVGPYNIAGNTTNQYQADAVILASGTNTITVPSWAAAVIINFATANAVVVTLKGVAGDTGIALDPNGITILDFNDPTPPANFVLSAASLLTNYTQIIFV